MASWLSVSEKAAAHLVSSGSKQLLDQCVYPGLLACARGSIEEEVGQVLAVCQSAQSL